MLIFTTGGGRFGNQIFNVIHLWAWQQRFHPEKSLCVLPFWPFAALFDLEAGGGPMIQGKAPLLFNWAYRFYCKLPAPWNRRWLKFFALLVEVWGRLAGWKAFHRPQAVAVVLDLADPAFNAQVKSSSASLLSGWPIRSWPLVQQMQPLIKSSLKPKATYVKSAEAWVGAFRAECEVLIGIQIRHGDYKQWLDGAYFFTIEQYAHWMRTIESHYPGQKVGFLVTSDEQQDERHFEGLHFRWSQGSVNVGGHYLLSILELSLCDLIVGPNSTFSAYAALYGNTPLQWINTANFKFNPAAASSVFELQQGWSF